MGSHVALGASWRTWGARRKAGTALRRPPGVGARPHDPAHAAGLPVGCELAVGEGEGQARRRRKAGELGEDDWAGNM